LQALHGFDVAPLKTAHFWSLAVEEQFYLVWPFVVAALPTRRLARVTLVMVVGAPALRLVLELAQAPAAALYTLPVTRMDALAIGAYLAARVRLEGGAAEAVHAFRRAAIPAAITLAGVVAMARTFELSTRAMRLGGYTAVAVLAGWVVAEALTARADGCLSRALGWSPLARLAQRSYAIYVLHFPLLALAAAAGLGAEPMSRALRSQVAGGLAWLVLVTAVTYALATVSWHVLEAPLLRFKDRLAPPERAREAPQGGVRAPGTVLTPCQQSLTASDSA
jgi:peptidoglycan/LPS O-acetylase OafA/YrhL